MASSRLSRACKRPVNYAEQLERPEDKKGCKIDVTKYAPIEKTPAFLYDIAASKKEEFLELVPGQTLMYNNQGQKKRAVQWADTQAQVDVYKNLHCSTSTVIKRINCAQPNKLYYLITEDDGMNSSEKQGHSALMMFRKTPKGEGTKARCHLTVWCLDCGDPNKKNVNNWQRLPTVFKRPLQEIKKAFNATVKHYVEVSINARACRYHVFKWLKKGFVDFQFFKEIK